MNTPSTAISPGLGGFFAFFILALALWFLMRNMNARMRRMAYRDELEAKKRLSGPDEKAFDDDPDAGDASHDSPGPN